MAYPGANVCVDASCTYEHTLGDTSGCGGGKSLRSSSVEVARPALNLVHDPRCGVCLVWRPVEGPPLPRCIHRENEAGEVDAEAVRYRDAPFACAVGRTDASTGNAVTALRMSSSSIEAHPPRKKIPCRGSPPRGQLLHRGKGGIDDVLRSAREAQSLFYSLQEQRLQAEYRRAQASLRQELDQQREYKRMLQLAEYQADLVNMFGHTMRDAVLDAFFDDGSDPVLSALHRKRLEGPTSRSAPYTSVHGDHSSGAAPPGVWRHRGSAGEGLVPPASTDESRLARERHVFKQALEELRGGRLCGY
ncbi:hypothetical protein Q4I28_006866 [Leishmania naiffi]|uniref:Uncharacterized protein n=1 Tax=Leishmania naiffi TaxID=5678 RepID=A0AAW3BBA8_9TRYP